MIIEFKLPDLGEGVTEGEVIRWLVTEGAPIAADQPMIEVATVKATVEIPSPAGGIVKRLCAKEGEIVPVGDTLIEIEAPEGTFVAPEAAHTKKDTVDLGAKAAPPPPKKAVSEGRVNATPRVRRLAADLGVPLEQVVGTGPNAATTEEDLHAFLQAREHESARLSSMSQKATDTGLRERLSLSGIRAATAVHMTKAAQVPTVCVVDEADLTELEVVRKEQGLSFVPYVVRAMILGIRAVPRINSLLHAERDELEVYDRINMGIAVQTEWGLVVPVLEDVGSLPAAELSDKLARLAESARNRALAPHQTRGGTITLTSAGRFANLFATPLLHVPQVAIVGLHRAEPRVVVRDGGIHVRTCAHITVSFDHRALDGADASRFLHAVIDALEQPRSLFG